MMGKNASQNIQMNFYTGEDRTKNTTVDKNISFSFS